MRRDVRPRSPRRRPSGSACSPSSWSAVLGGGAVVGAAVRSRPVDRRSRDAWRRTTTPSTSPCPPVPAGARRQPGRLHAATCDDHDRRRRRAGELRVRRSSAPTADPVTDFDGRARQGAAPRRRQPRPRRRYAHVHPTRDAAGTWTRRPARRCRAGSYRRVRRLRPDRRDRPARSAPTSPCPATHPTGSRCPPRRPTRPSTATTSRSTGELVAGAESTLTVTVTPRRRSRSPTSSRTSARSGTSSRSATATSPTSTSTRSTTLDGAGRAAVRFAVDVPTAGTYGLFFDFSHGGAVRTAASSPSRTSAGVRRRDDRHADGRPRRRTATDHVTDTRTRTTAGAEVDLRHRRHDVRLVRGPHRAAAQQARRRHGDRQLRHRAGQRRTPRRGRRRRPHRPGRGGRLHRPRRPAGRARRPTTRRRRWSRRRDARRCATGCSSRRVLSVPVVAAGDGPGAAVRRLAVAVADARRAGRDLGGVAVPPGGLAQPAPRHRHDGHADLARRAGRVRLVAVRPVPRRRRRARA